MNIISQSVMVSSILTDLYSKAFELFKFLLRMMQFPHVASRLNERFGEAGSSLELIERQGADYANRDGWLFNSATNAFESVLGDGLKWRNLWYIAKDCFTALESITIPIATIFFLISIYKAVISKAPEEQPKEFLLESIRFILIIFISTNLFTILTYITTFSEDLTDAVYAQQQQDTTLSKYTSAGGDPNTGPDFWTQGMKTITDAIKKNEESGDANPTFKDLMDGDIIRFCEKIFTYLLYFLGGIATLLVFASSGYTIVMTTIQRIIKPLIMMPFATIVVGIGASSGEGERMMWHYAKSFLGFCLSSVFILMAIKMGLSLADVDLFKLSDVMSTDINDDGDRLMLALIALFRVNLPVVITTGLVKSADSFMEKIFA